MSAPVSRRRVAPTLATLLAPLAIGVLVTASTGDAIAQTITADGSSTVYPITSEAARRTGFAVDNQFSGTTGGFRRFCAGETDISNASRPINSDEIAACASAEVEFIELPIAFDAIAVVAHPTNNWARSITTDELKRLWEPAAQDTVTTWKQVRNSWPDQEIKLYGRGQDSGTYDYFTSVIVGEARSSRTDYTASENEEELAAAIAAEPNALGFFGVGAYFRHWEELEDVAVDSGGGPVHPAMREVLAGSYQPLARPLFLYVRTSSLAEKPSLRAFLEAYLADIGNWVHFTGYMPLSSGAYERSLERLSAGTTGTRFDGVLQVGMGIDDLFD